MKKVYVSLTGGLGNQLFQLSAAMSLIEDNGEILLLDAFGSPRSTNQLPDVCGFEMPQSVKYLDGITAPFFLKKAVGFYLRMGIEPRGLEKLHFLSCLYKWILSLLVSVFFREVVEVVNGKDVGYSDIKISKRKILLVGYFQSYKYAESLKNNLERLKLDNEDEITVTYSNLVSNLENRLIVHLRLTDYLSEEKFGIPNQSYYEESLKIMFDLRQFTEVWIFSDDIELARMLFRAPKKIETHWMECADLEPCEILTLMQFGAGYIIANSTFGWWAAYLSRCPNPLVIAPHPWFRRMTSPSHLVPSNWTKVKAWS